LISTIITGIECLNQQPLAHVCIEPFQESEDPSNLKILTPSP